ncbi:MAG: DUF177 domain-containing protein [Kiritimatiellae bacterium]|jgi:uncharacterized metal-binding protein YceD (DUF177 family)|nr:DUF177 domain-containing protein [Kiritimatiellia bacterium]
MEEKLLIDASRLADGGENISGEVDCVDIHERLVKPFGGVRYSLRAQAIAGELLVKGHLEQDFTLVCSRCGQEFDDTVKVDDFVFSCQIDEKSPVVDLTEDARESIILTLSSYPVCSEDCPGIEQTGGAPVDGRWDALNALFASNGPKGNKEG